MIKKTQIIEEAISGLNYLSEHLESGNFRGGIIGPATSTLFIIILTIHDEYKKMSSGNIFLEEFYKYGTSNKGTVNGFVVLNYVTLNGFLTGLEGIGNFANKNRMSINTGTFSKSARHISISTRRGNYLQNINITQGDRPDAAGGAAGMNFGIKLNDCQGNTVRNNTFNNVSTAISVAKGLETYRIGKELQIIGPYNTFNKYSTAAFSDNGCPEIEYLCNSHSNNAIDFFWENARITQGTSETGAGNTFSTGASSTNIFTGYPIKYFYGLGSNEFPQTVSPPLTRIQTETFGCNFNFGSGLSDNPTELDNDYQYLVSAINTLKSNYPSNDLVIADSIHKLEILLHEVTKQAITIITSPSEGQIDNNFLILWLQRINTFESYSQIALIHFMEGNYIQAYSELSLLPSQFNLTQSEQEDLVSMFWFYNFLLPIYQSGRWEGDLTNSEIISLQNFASNTPTRIGLVATNILNFFYDNQNNINQIKSNENIKIENQSIHNLVVSESIKLYPNPSRDFLNLEINNSNSNALYSFSIANINGTLIDHVLIGSDIVTYSTEKLPHGVYFITIFKDSIPIHISKLFKSF